MAERNFAQLHANTLWLSRVYEFITLLEIKENSPDGEEETCMVRYYKVKHVDMYISYVKSSPIAEQHKGYGRCGGGSGLKTAFNLS